jgi:hypothetical protein
MRYGEGDIYPERVLVAELGSLKESGGDEL